MKPVGVLVFYTHVETMGSKAEQIEMTLRDTD